jgi:hypothetical protein
MFDHRQRNLEFSILDIKRDMSRKAARAKDMADKIQELQGRLDSIPVSFSNDSNDDTRAAVMDWFFLLVFVAAFMVDVALLYPALDFIVNPLITSRTARTFVVLGTTLAIIMLEAYLAVQIVYAQESEAPKGRRLRWSIMAGLFAVVIPAGVAATFAVTDFGFSPWASAILLVMLILLSIGCHIAILFGGARLFDAADHRQRKIRRSHHSRKIVRATRRNLKYARLTGEIYQIYMREIHVFRGLYPERQLHLGRFDETTREILSRQYPGEKLPESNSNGFSMPSKEGVEPEARRALLDEPVVVPRAGAQPPVKSDGRSLSTTET